MRERETEHEKEEGQREKAKHTPRWAQSQMGPCDSLGTSSMWGSTQGLIQDPGTMT